MLFHRQLFSSNSHWCAFFISRNQSIRQLISFQNFQEFGPCLEAGLPNPTKSFWLAQAKLYSKERTFGRILQIIQTNEKKKKIQSLCAVFSFLFLI
jgi:hypothetical protein